MTTVTVANQIMPFVKLDCGILDSTLWSERLMREVFVTALLMAEPYVTDVELPQLAVRAMQPTGWSVPPGWYGFVPAAGVGILARALVVDKEAGLAALERLGEPEDESRSQDFAGRRLVRVDGGYVVLNYDRYRHRDETGAERQRRYRERRKREKESRVTNNASRVIVTQAEAEAEAEAEVIQEQREITREGDCGDAPGGTDDTASAPPAASNSRRGVSGLPSIRTPRTAEAPASLGAGRRWRSSDSSTAAVGLASGPHGAPASLENTHSDTAGTMPAMRPGGAGDSEGTDGSRELPRAENTTPAFDYVRALAQLVQAYPAHRRQIGNIVEYLFVEAVRLGPGTPAQAFERMLANLAAQRRSQQWQDPSYAPKLVTWLREGQYAASSADADKEPEPPDCTHCVAGFAIRTVDGTRSFVTNENGGRVSCTFCQPPQRPSERSHRYAHE
ncbi:MAG: hypothetical protein ABL982_00155 [Vicinamibacterales bacterium]